MTYLPMPLKKGGITAMVLAMNSILLVDDDPVMLDTLKDVLESPELVIKTATKIADALTLLGQETIPLLVTDHGLPDGTGLDLAQQAKAKNPQLKVILMTGNAELAGNSATWAANVDHYLIKPVDPDHLQKLIQQLLPK